MPDLKSCPFCGDEAQPALVHGGGIEWAQVECVNRDCGAVGPTPATEADAIAAWNTRHPAPLSEEIQDFLRELDGWENAYPLTAFPEPDLKRAAELLKAGGMTLDSISASNMRHVVSRIVPKARAAITALSTTQESNRE